MTTTLEDVRETAVRSIRIMADGARADFDAIIAPGAVNREDAVEPPACRVGGPAGFHATALWLREAFADLRHDVENVLVEGDLVAVDCFMSGRHVGDFVTYDEAGRVEQAWVPTGKTFRVRQSHWLRVEGGLVVEHWAVRDDLGQGMQLGWVPPTPLYLLRCARARRRAARDGG